VLPDVALHATAAFREPGDRILLVGDLEPSPSLGGSEYLAVCHGTEAGRPPALDMQLELAVQSAVRTAIREGLVASAHDCADGGLAVALAESCIWGGVGAAVRLPGPVNADRLFGEAPSRVVLSVAADNMVAVSELLRAAGVSFAELGEVGGEWLRIEGAGEIPVTTLEVTWERTIPAALGA
jgi:phosphoribosylformylglycinamidine synthase subunit PurL